MSRPRGPVWSEMSCAIFPSLYFLFQHMALLQVMGTFGCPRWHWAPQFRQLKWAPVSCDFGLPKKSRSQRESPRREAILWNSWVCCKERGLREKNSSFSLACRCLRRVRVLWSLLHSYAVKPLKGIVWLYCYWLQFASWFWSRTRPLLLLILWLKSSESSRNGEGDVWVQMTAVYMRGETRIITN